ncbi:MAG: hypothetical protein FD123_4299 [Bacteroidetes bacterium]|nr:MAG: hypothetical protein FD123_4299 [Bacteroidota bacterium]
MRYFNIVLFTCVSFLINAQSTSVFDACYFDRDGAKPPIKAGKGFHINDVYKQTRSCFTPESVKPDLMTNSGGGSSTTIKVHYTSSEEEYYYLRTSGSSGKIGFLNLFSVGGSKLEQYATMEHQSTERLVFIARTDFGVYSYDTDPIILPEPKALLEGGKYGDFIDMYGTHYISGVRKQNSIWVVLTRTGASSGSSTGTQNTVGVGVELPSRLGGTYEVTDETKANQLISNSNYSISIEVYGPAMEKGSLERGINGILSSKRADQLKGIKDLIVSAAKGLSDPTNSYIAQYYYSPFTLYGLKSIYWDQKKEQELSQVNEAVFTVCTTKSELDEFLAPDGLNKLIDTVNMYIPDNFSQKQFYLGEIRKTYNKIQPTLKIYKKQLDTSISYLEKVYLRCSDIRCNSVSNCCNNSNIESKYKNIDTKIDAEYQKLLDVIEAAAKAYVSEASVPECQKEKIGYLYVVNKSTNPYELYQGDEFIQTLSGGSTTTFKLKAGTYKFKATQRSGYAFYPTVNYRTITISNICEEVTIKVGFED